MVPIPSRGESQNDNSKEPEAFKASVLVIDDEPSFCFAISEILSLSGYEVRQAYTVEQARAILVEIVPDIILTDIMMPGVDGLTFLRQIRRDDRLCRVPAIALSAKAMKADKAAAVAAGANGYLSKPFSAQELKETIEPFLNGKDR